MFRGTCLGFNCSHPNELEFTQRISWGRYVRVSDRNYDPCLSRVYPRKYIFFSHQKLQKAMTGLLELSTLGLWID
jgi:hypothetical protein